MDSHGTNPDRKSKSASGEYLIYLAISPLSQFHEILKTIDNTHYLWKYLRIDSLRWFFSLWMNTSYVFRKQRIGPNAVNISLICIILWITIPDAN